MNPDSKIEYLDSRKHKDFVLEALNKQREENFYDVVLVSGIDGKRVPTHRVILIAVSDYFKAMFTNAMKECTAKEITFEHIHGDVLEDLVEFFYTGEIEFHEDRIENLLSAAHLFQENYIVQGCCKFLERQLDSENCVGITFFAAQLNCKGLMEIAKAYTCQHFKNVIKGEEFFKMSAEQFGEILACDELNADSEEEIFKSMVAWLERSKDEKKKMFQYLLKYIRLQFMCPEFLFEVVKPMCIEYNSESTFIEATKLLLLRNVCPIDNTSIKPRRSYDKSLFILGIIQNNVGLIEIYNSSKRKWNIEKTFALKQRKFKSVLRGDCLIMIGSYIYDANNSSTKVESLNLKSMRYKSWKSLQQPIEEFSVVVLDETIYVIGGKVRIEKEESILRTVQRCESIDDQWKKVANMNIARFKAGVAVLNTNIYVVGGCSRNNSNLSSVECYNKFTNKWTLKAPINYARHDCSVISLNGFLYVFGGQLNSKLITVERYDPKFNSWTSIFSMLSTRYNAYGLDFKRILALNSKSVEIFNPQTKKFTADSDLSFVYEAIYIFNGSKEMFY